MFSHFMKTGGILKTSRLFTAILITGLLLILPGCQSGKTIEPTLTLTPTITPIPTNAVIATEAPTITSTLTFVKIDEYLKLLPKDIPEGFSWKVIPQRGLAVLLPDGWFYKEEPQDDLKYDGVYVSKENIDETGRFSTGLSVFVFYGFNNKTETEEYARSLVAQQKNLETTKEIIKEWDYTTNTYTVHHLRIKAEYPYEDEINQNKIVQYSVMFTNDSVYWIVFESPASQWDQTIANYGILLDYVVFFFDQ
jgi:hypothetical protein